MTKKEILKAFDRAAEHDPEHDERHGGAYDRGSADYYYGRGRHPHFFIGDTYNSEKIDCGSMTESQIRSYDAGYDAAKACGDRKEWRNYDIMHTWAGPVDPIRVQETGYGARGKL